MEYPSIFFNVEITGEASHRSRLRDVAQHVSLKLMDDLRTDEYGIHAYFNFRSQSEVASINDSDCLSLPTPKLRQLPGLNSEIRPRTLQV